MTPDQLARHKARIDGMSRLDMARLYNYYGRDALSEHPYFQDGTPLSIYFADRFERLGRFNPDISKDIDRQHHDPDTKRINARLV